MPDSGSARGGLVIDGLSVRYPSGAGPLHALQDVSLSVAPGEVLGLVGESGSGKSTVLLALLGLLEPGAMQARRLGYDGHDLLRKAPVLRGRRVGMVFQDTAAALNPALTVGAQLTEPMRLHLGSTQQAAWTRGTELLAETGIPRPAEIMRAYPHQLSGGMKQRVGIATALATEPDLLLLDEPTTALDVTVEAQILALLAQLQVQRGLSMLLVSHNLGIVDRLCDTVAVLYAGRVAETGPAADVLYRPRHPYTKGLLAALPRPDRPHAGRLAPIPGGLPDLRAPDPGCNFRPRCAFAGPGCETPQHLAGIPNAAACHRADALCGHRLAAGRDGRRDASDRARCAAAGGTKPHGALRLRRFYRPSAWASPQRAGGGCRVAADRRRRGGGAGGRVRLRQVHARPPAAAAAAVAGWANPVRRPAGRGAARTPRSAAGRRSCSRTRTAR